MEIERQIQSEPETLRLVVSESVGSEWLKWLEDFNGNIYHSIEWAETCRSTHSRPLYFRWLDNDGRCLGIAVGIKSWSPIPYVGYFLKRLDFETYPAVQGNDVDLARFMIKQLLKFAKDGGYRSLTIQSFCANVMVPDMDRLGFVTTARMEFMLDLSLSENERWKRLSEHHRRKIKKAGRHGLLFEEACTLDAMRQLRKLQFQSRDRRVQRGEKFNMFKDAHYEDAHYEEMGRNYFDKNLGRVFFMTHEGWTVSTAFVSMYAGKAYSVYTGSSEEGFRLDASALLFWKIFSRCRELGCREFNMGGVSASAADPKSQSYGLYRFKAGFGGRQVMCQSGSADNLSPIHSALEAVVKKGWNIWKSS